jgi:hypothetical protein
VQALVNPSVQLIMRWKHESPRNPHTELVCLFVQLFTNFNRAHTSRILPESSVLMCFGGGQFSLLTSHKNPIYVFYVSTS